jgi:hypothetical protein
MNKIKTNLLAFVLLLVGCHSSTNTINPSPSEQNAISQNNPTIMIIPSDELLSRIGCMKSIENQGKTSYVRDYNAAYLNDGNLKFTIASIEQFFASANYPLENLQQQLKSIENNNALDEADNVVTDARTKLMNTARPDFVLDLDYKSEQDPSSRNPKTILSYTLTCIDVYTNKAIGSLTRANVGEVESGRTVESLIKDDLQKNLPTLQKQIQQRFKDEIENGVEVTLRITTMNNANLNLGDECLGTVNYNDWVNDWLKKNTINATYKPVINSDKELRYTNVRIKAKNKDGLKYIAFDFANELKAAISKACGIKSQNRTQSIGDASIEVSGLR